MRKTYGTFGEHGTHGVCIECWKSQILDRQQCNHKHLQESILQKVVLDRHQTRKATYLNLLSKVNEGA